MMDAIFSKRSLVPRERNRIPEDFRPKHLRLAGSAHGGEEHGTLLDGVGIDLEKLEDDLKPDRLQEIAALMRTLTYGEMIRFAQDLWKTRPDGPLDEHNLPMMLHLWSNPAAWVEPACTEPADDKPGDDKPAVEIMPTEQ